MKAIAFQSLGEVAVVDRPEPRIAAAGDVVVRVTTAGICGSDLHIVEGRDPGVRLGTVMGHELIGIVAETGPGVTRFASGDRVLAPFSVNCGHCFYCLRDLPGRCQESLCFGFVTEDGVGLEGAQAEYVRVPLADSSLLKVPEHRPEGTSISDEEVMFLGDIFSTGYSCAERAELRRGDTVLVVGCGPVGLLAALSARWLGAGCVVAVDPIGYRREKAAELGMETLEPRAEEVIRRLAERTGGRGADAVLEAVGSAPALDLALAAVRPGGIVSIAGYHTAPVYPLPVHAAYMKNLTLKIGRCNARHYMEKLLPRVLAGELPASLAGIVSHILPLQDGVHGYRIFGRHEDSATKVVLKPGG